jgi:hypothetical protein
MSRSNSGFCARAVVCVATTSRRHQIRGSGKLRDRFGTMVSCRLVKEYTPADAQHRDDELGETVALFVGEEDWLLLGRLVLNL